MPDQQPELNDIVQMINNYIAVNKKKVVFIGAFVAFKDGSCNCCGDSSHGVIRNDASRYLAFGSLGDLRLVLNDLRDVVEDEVDQNGFVRI